jgi:hypothetical protein
VTIPSSNGQTFGAFSPANSNFLKIPETNSEKAFAQFNINNISTYENYDTSTDTALA